MSAAEVGSRRFPDLDGSRDRIEARPGKLRVAVIGATGSVGRQVCGAFSARGHTVLAIARNHAAQVSGYEFVALDVAAAAAETIAGLLSSARLDVVVNAAGRWGPTEAEMLHSHVRLVGRVLEAMALLAGPRPRLVHLGTVHEYGEVPAGILVHEGIEPNPTKLYAKVKLECSQAILDATKAGYANGVVLRAANMFGPYPPAETFFAGLLRQLRESGAQDRPIELGIADAKRDFVDVRDVAAAVVKAAEAPVAGRVINIGRGVAVDMRELVLLFVEAAGFPLERLKMERKEVRSQGGDWTRIDIGLARELLGWTPRIAARESMRAMWESR